MSSATTQGFRGRTINDPFALLPPEGRHGGAEALGFVP